MSTIITPEARRTLWQIGQDAQALEDLLLEMGGDVTDEAVAEAIDHWMAEIQGNLEEKMDRYAALIAMVQDRIAVRKREINRLQALSEPDINLAEKLKERMHRFMEQQGLNRIDTPRYRISVVANGGRKPLVIDNPEMVPDALLFVRTEPDRIAIREALEAGQDLPFAHLEERGTHLRIN